MSSMKDEEFPPLQTRKKDPPRYLTNTPSSSSRRSSVSSQSSAALGVPFKLSSKQRVLTENAVCRKFMFCKCKKCTQKNFGALSKQKWNNLRRYPCQKAKKLVRGTECEVLYQRRYGNQGDMLAYVVGFDENWKKFKGWVHPDAVGGVNMVKFALEQKSSRTALSRKKIQPAVRKPFNTPQDDFFSPEDSFVAPVEKVESMYKFRELVLCREYLGCPWVPAEVTTESPFKIKPQGSSKASTWDLRNVKKYPQSKFISVRDMPVRVNQNEASFVQTILPKGTTIGVVKLVEMKNSEARITSPVCGWVTLRTLYEVNAVEESYSLPSEQMHPCIFIGHLANGTTSQAVASAISGLGEGFMPSGIQLFPVGGDNGLAAKVWFDSHVAGNQLAGRKLIVHGREVVCFWCIDYLRYKAKQELF